MFRQCSCGGGVRSSKLSQMFTIVSIPSFHSVRRFKTGLIIRTIIVVKELFDVGIEQDEALFISKKGAGRSRRLIPKTRTHSWSVANSENI